MVIIGITGAIGHGKSTFADILLKTEPSSLHLESFHLIAEVIDQLLPHLREVPADQDLETINHWLSELPAILQKTTRLEQKPQPIVLTAEAIAANPVEYKKLFTQLALFRQQPELLDQKLTDANKPSYRPLLQWIGGYVTNHVDARAWYEELVRRAQEAGEQGTQLIVIGGLRFPNDAAVIHEAGGTVLKIVRPDAEQPDLTDPTEREREAIKFDSEVINDGDLAQLEACAKRVLHDVYGGQLQPRYQSSSL